MKSFIEEINGLNANPDIEEAIFILSFMRADVALCIAKLENSNPTKAKRISTFLKHLDMVLNDLEDKNGDI